MTDRTTVRLPDNLLQRAKRKAAREGRTLTALIEDGLRLVLNGEKDERKARVLPPVSSARGGVMPGIDLDDTAALQELDDHDAAERP